MHTKKGLLLVVSAMMLCVSAFSLHRQVEETEAIRRALQYYLDGHATGDPEVMAQAFHPSARLQAIQDGEVAVRSLESYLGGMSGRPAADESERERRIVMVDYEGTAAVARIELDYPQVRFVDYMQLLKIGGEWKIVNKIYHMERE